MKLKFLFCLNLPFINGEIVKLNPTQVYNYTSIYKMSLYPIYPNSYQINPIKDKFISNLELNTNFNKITFQMFVGYEAIGLFGLFYNTLSDSSKNFRIFNFAIGSIPFINFAIYYLTKYFYFNNKYTNLIENQMLIFIMLIIYCISILIYLNFINKNTLIFSLLSQAEKDPKNVFSLSNLFFNTSLTNSSLIEIIKKLKIENIDFKKINTMDYKETNILLYNILNEVKEKYEDGTIKNLGLSLEQETIINYFCSDENDLLFFHILYIFSIIGINLYESFKREHKFNEIFKIIINNTTQQGIHYNYNYNEKTKEAYNLLSL
jgi:hypothetical protein